jgi:hypothetical protein
MQVKLGTSYINYLRWIYEFVPSSLKTSSMISSQYSVTSTSQLDQESRDEAADLKLTFSIAVDDFESEEDISCVENSSLRKKRKTAPQPARPKVDTSSKVQKKKTVSRVVTTRKRTQARVAKKTKSRGVVVDDSPITVDMESLTAETCPVVEHQGLTDIVPAIVDSENFDFGGSKKVTGSTPMDSDSVVSQCLTESSHPIVTEDASIVESVLENKPQAETFSESEETTLTDSELIQKSESQIHHPEIADSDPKQLLHSIVENLQRASPKLLRLIYSIIVDHNDTTN